MTTCAQPVISAGHPSCDDRAGKLAVHAFGRFAPFGAEWSKVFAWEFGEACTEEWLWSLRFDTLSSFRFDGPEGPFGPVPDPRKLPPSSSRGFLHFRILASRPDGKLGTDFFCDSSGIDLYANFVRVELWAPEGIVIATGNAQATQGSEIGVLDEYVAPSVTRIGSSLRPIATLHTYAEAGVLHPVPPKAQRYSVLSGEQPDLYVGATSVATGAPASSSLGGVDGLQLGQNNSVIAWEVAP